MKVEYIDHMGDDIRVVNAARISFHKESDWEYGFRIEHEGKEHGMISLSEADQKLIRYLATHNHWTPFSHVQITLREKVPIFVARQRFKHMVGFTYNEVSRRYVDEAPEFFIPKMWRGRHPNAKQGSSDEVITELETEHEVWDEPQSPMMTWDIKDAYNAVIETCSDVYELMIKNGVAPEQARMVLPQSMMTEYYTTGSLAAWARAYKLRAESHAQAEIRELATKWDQIISNIEGLKHSWEALKNN